MTFVERIANSHRSDVGNNDGERTADSPPFTSRADDDVDDFPDIADPNDVNDSDMDGLLKSRTRPHHALNNHPTTHSLILTVTLLVVLVLLVGWFLIDKRSFFLPSLAASSPSQPDVKSPANSTSPNILWIQSYHTAEILSSHLLKRVYCYTRMHGYTYAMNIGIDIYQYAITIPSLPFRREIRAIYAPPPFWFRVYQLYAAMYDPRAFLSHSTIVRLPHLFTHVERFDWIVYTDIDTAINNAHFTMEQLIAIAQNKTSSDCWLIAQDNHAILNTGVMLFRNSPQTKEILRLWLQQWIHHYDDYWLSDQGPFQEVILIYLNSRNPARYPYKIGHCWAAGPRLSTDERDACYAQVLNQWNLTYEHRSTDGICLLGKSTELNDNYYLSNTQIFLHRQALRNKTKLREDTPLEGGGFNQRDAPLFNDFTCSWWDD